MQIQDDQDWNKVDNNFADWTTICTRFRSVPFLVGRRLGVLFLHQIYGDPSFNIHDGVQNPLRRDEGPTHGIKRVGF